MKFLLMLLHSDRYTQTISSLPKFVMAAPVDLVIGGPQLSALEFLLHASASHSSRGFLLGVLESRCAATDAAEASVEHHLVVTGVSFEPASDGIVGEFSLRRRTSHRLSFKDVQFLTRPHATPRVLLLMTEQDSEAGLQTTHYTAFATGKTPRELPLKVTNLISTGGEYAALQATSYRGTCHAAGSNSSDLDSISQNMVAVASHSSDGILSQMDAMSTQALSKWNEERKLTCFVRNRSLNL